MRTSFEWRKTQKGCIDKSKREFVFFKAHDLEQVGGELELFAFDKMAGDRCGARAIGNFLDKSGKGGLQLAKKRSEGGHGDTRLIEVEESVVRVFLIA